MIYYVIALLLLAGFKLPRRVYCVLATIMLVCFAGLRADSVGTDTAMYRYLFNDFQYIHSFRQLKWEHSVSSLSMEWGYYFITFILQKIISFDVFKVLQAMATIIPWGYLIYKRSDHPWVSFFILFTLPIFSTMTLSAMRQGVAFGISALAMDAMMDKKNKKAILLVALAFMFHYSSIIILPLMFFNKQHYRHKSFLYILPILIVVYFSSSTIFSFLTQYSRIDYEAGDAGGIGTLIFLLGLYALSFLVKDKYFKEGINNWLVYLLIYTIALWFIGMNLAAIFRLAAYSEGFICLYVSNLLFYTSKSLRKLIISVVCIGTILLMSQLVVSTTKGNNFYPYHFTWEEQSYN